MSYAMSIDLVQPFEEVVPRVKQALAANGFGIVSEIDMQKTLMDKIGVEIGPQVILGACNPRRRRGNRRANRTRRGSSRPPAARVTSRL